MFRLRLLRRPVRTRATALLAMLLVVVAACSSDKTSDADKPTTTTTASIDTSVHLNEIQVLGTHNSYHKGVPDDVFNLLESFDQSLADSLDYKKVPLREQLEQQGARQIELDVFADPDGGLFADRHVNTALGKPIASGVPELDKPGFKVFHVQEIDFESTCITFVECLQQVKAWSDDTPDHLPVLIMVEAKDTPIADPVNLGFVTPHLIRGPEVDALDAEIRSVFSDGDLITPDDIRGSHTTLREAVTTDGWPTLAASRGKVFFALDNENEVRDAYMAGHANLEGRVLFTSVDPSDPAAAFVKLNEPETDGAKIRELVKQGFVIRTRSDADTVQARTGDTTMREAALASGAQFISSDYLVADTRLSDYKVELLGGEVARCNPVNAPPTCKDADLKP